MVSSATQTDFTGQNLSDRDFSGQNLAGYIFKNCTLTGTNFSGCTFDGTTVFTGALFGKSPADQVTDFSGCVLTAAQFTVPAQFGRMGDGRHPTKLNNATVPWDLLGKTMQYVDLTGTLLPNLPADLSMVMLTGITWPKADFRGKNLRNAHFMSCNLASSVFTGATLDYASFIQLTDLTGAKLDRCSLYHVVFDSSTLTSVDLSYSTKFANCTFLNALLKGTVFDGNDLTTSKFSVPAMLSTNSDYITSFRFATITTDFLITNLQKNWQCMDLRSVQVANFSSIVGQLYNLQAQNSRFNNAVNFANARLNGANFNNAQFNGVSFNGAQLNNAQLQNTQTLTGTAMGPAAALFNLVQNDSGQPPPDDYTSLLAALAKNDVASIAAIFQHYGWAIGNLTVTAVQEPGSQNPAWSIVSKQTAPPRTYLVVKSAAATGQLALLAYDQTPATFSYAQLIGSYLQGSNFSNSALDHVQLFGAFVTYANLSGVNMTGAQLGENAAIFSLAQNDSTNLAPYDYTSFLNDLQNGLLANIIDVFQHYGYPIGSISCAAAVPPAGAVAAWLIKDKLIVPARSFTVSQMVVQVSPPLYELAVFFNDAHPAVLDNSYMPGIVLTQANLTACSAQYCHLYNNQQTGSAAVLNQATLIEVQFANSNLYKADFTQAVLNGANFSGANLMGAVLKTKLAPADSGQKVSFHSANLQGADFTGATIESANFLNAAICLALPSSTTDTDGVWLSRATAANDPNFASYLTELAAASSLQTITSPPPDTLASHFLQPGVVSSPLISILAKIGLTVSASAQVAELNSVLTWRIIDGMTTYILIPGYDADFTVAYNVYAAGEPAALCNLDALTKLQVGPVPAALAATLKTNSAGKIVLGNDAVLGQYQRANVWTITDAAAGHSYTLWWGVQLLGTKLRNLTYVRASFFSLVSLFSQCNVGLRLQTLLTQTTDSKANTTTWLVDMGKNDSYYLQTGYLQFKVVGNSATSPTQLDIYGYTMRMAGLGNEQQQVIQDFDCQPTVITQDVMDDETLLPNNQTKIQNVGAHLPFGSWMQAYNAWPKPPVCVPTGISYCPAPQQN